MYRPSADSDVGSTVALPGDMTAAGVQFPWARNPGG
jgi:hypothetical protein